MRQHTPPRLFQKRKGVNVTLSRGCQQYCAYDTFGVHTQPNTHELLARTQTRFANNQFRVLLKIQISGESTSQSTKPASWQVAGYKQDKARAKNYGAAYV
jgi:hypothetical protein